MCFECYSNANDNDKFAVCAPRIILESKTKSLDKLQRYRMHGICYWTTNTSTDQPNNIQTIAKALHSENELRIKHGTDNVINYIFGEQGISVHITENNQEILIGAPGVFLWVGTVARHKANRIDVPKPLSYMSASSYFGFAISSGYFDGPTKNLRYVASAPRAYSLHGMVYIFDIIRSTESKEKTEIKINRRFAGPNFGEYFGYTLIAEDFNNDGFTDIAIAAPYHSKRGSYDNGAVYIYKRKKKIFDLQTTLKTDYEYSGQFGTTMSKVGDLNNDGFNDLIVAAPFENNGAIYIYHGSANGLSSKPSQKIVAPQSGSELNQMFGYGLSKGVDIDDNKYRDIAVGSPNTDTVYIFRSYPIIRAKTSITPDSQEIQTTDKSFNFTVCWMYESTKPIKFDIDFNAIIKLDAQSNRVSFNDSKTEYTLFDKMTAHKQCKIFTVNVTYSAADIYKPIDLEMAHNVLNGMPSNGAGNVTQGTNVDNGSLFEKK